MSLLDNGEKIKRKDENRMSRREKFRRRNETNAETEFRELSEGKMTVEMAKEFLEKEGYAVVKKVDMSFLNIQNIKNYKMEEDD